MAWEGNGERRLLGRGRPGAMGEGVSVQETFRRRDPGAGVAAAGKEVRRGGWKVGPSKVAAAG